MKINNINKRIISSSIALALIPSVLTGCTTSRFEYSTNENNEIVASGTISYEILKDCYYVEIENPDYDKMEYYIASKDNYQYYAANTVVGYSYYDLLTDREIYQRNTNDYESLYKTNRKFIKEIKVEDYLLSENFIKNAYTVDDVKNIFDAIKENEQGKKIVKE